jgi:CRP-like cAMP-binding protein
MSSQPMPGRLSPDLLQALQGVKPVRRFPKGATLIQQTTMATGVYVVASGGVRVLLPTGPNERQLLEVAGPGSMLGLSENVTGGKL